MLDMEVADQLVAHALSARLAADELEFFDDIVLALKAPPERPRDRALAFGIPELAALTTPLLLKAGTIVVPFLALELANATRKIMGAGSDALAEEAKKRIAAWAGSAFAKPLAPEWSGDDKSKVAARLEASLAAQLGDKVRAAEIARAVADAL